MQFIKKRKEKFLIYVIYIISIFILSILNQLFLPINISKYMVIIITFSLFFILSFKEGKKRQNKGYIAGIKISLIGIVLFIFINIIMIQNQISVKTIIYYLIFILINIYGSILGINKKAS